MLRDRAVRGAYLLLGALFAACSPPGPEARSAPRPLTDARPERAWAEVRTDEVTQLPFEDGEFRVPISAIDYYSQKDPRAALRTWIRAWDAQRFDVLLRLIPAPEQTGLTPEVLKAKLSGPAGERMAVLLDVLRLEVQNGAIEYLGDRAALSYGNDRAVHLHLEGTLWKIEEF